MRIVRLVATPVILLSLLGILLSSASWGWHALTAPFPSASPTPCVTQQAEVVTPAQVSVHVRNGGFTSGLATRVGKKLKDAGFVVLSTGNTERQTTTTVVLGNPQEQAQLNLVASYFNGATIQHDERIDGTVDVLVGTEFGDFAATPLTEVPAEKGIICAVATPTPSPSPSPSA